METYAFVQQSQTCEQNKIATSQKFLCELLPTDDPRTFAEEEHGFNMHMGPVISGGNGRHYNPISTTILIKRKQLCLFLPGWLSCAKKTLDTILHKNLRALFGNKKYADLFKEYDICIIFRNNASLKNLIVKTEL